MRRMADVERMSGSIRVYVDMVADLFHAGHASFLRQAKELGASLHPGRDVELVVGVHSDDTVLGYKREPVCSMEERVAVVRSIAGVASVVPDAPLLLTPEYLDAHAVDLVVHGDDISDETRRRWYEPAVVRGIFHTVPYTPGICTTEIIERIRARDREKPEDDSGGMP